MDGLRKNTKEWRSLQRERDEVYAAKIALQWASGIIIKTPLRCFQTGTTKLDEDNATNDNA
jgi:hypothetical protein